MSDIADNAADTEALFLNAALNAASCDFDSPSTTLCCDCGDDIPPARRALGGVTRCIDCQTDHEHQQQRFAAWRPHG